MTTGRLPSVEGGIQPTIVDAKGDLIVATAADTVSRIAVGSNDQVLTADSSTATGLKWATPAAGGGGKVLQVVNATYDTPTSNSTSTFADTGLSLSITPTSATSKVLVIVNQAGLSRGNQDDTNAVRLQLLRGATVILNDFAGNVGSNTSGYLWAGASGTSYLDSPATTSSTTYKTQFKNNRNGSLVTVQSDTSVSTITLLEIGA